jgi:hypothetical protein
MLQTFLQDLECNCKDLWRVFTSVVVHVKSFLSMRVKNVKYQLIWKLTCRKKARSNAKKINIKIVIKYTKLYKKKTKYQPRVVDHSARGSMKNAANCVQTCELQDTWTPTFWTHMAVWNNFQTMFGWGLDIKQKPKLQLYKLSKFYAELNSLVRLNMW